MRERGKVAVRECMRESEWEWEWESGIGCGCVGEEVIERG